MHHLFVIPVPFCDHCYEIFSLFLSYRISITVLFAHTLPKAAYGNSCIVLDRSSQLIVDLYTM